MRLLEIPFNPPLFQYTVKKLQYRIEFAALRTVLLFVKIVPVRLIPIIYRFLGLFMYYTGVRKKVVDKNLSIAFDSTPGDKELRAIRKRTYINAAAVLMEFLYMGVMPKERIHDHISIEGLDVLEDALEEQRGVVVAGNHYGNWELLTGAISHAGYPLHIYSGMQKNRKVDDTMNGIRRRFGTVTISKSKKAAIEMLKVMKSNQLLGMAGDLNVPHDNLFVDFFGVRAVVGQGLASFTLKRKAPLLFIWSVRTGEMKYKGFVKRIHYQISGDEKEDMASIAQSISSELEDVIRQSPDQYFWFNRRWKTRPPEEKGVSIY